MERWNKIIAKAGVDFEFKLPHTAFHRQIGEFRDVRATPAGVLISDAEWQRTRDDYLPSAADGDFIASLMTPISEPGKFAGWIAPPKVGIDNKPGDFEYVRIAA
jgi:benzoyl-CoA 2,3-dioxygenase component B